MLIKNITPKIRVQSSDKYRTLFEGVSEGYLRNLVHKISIPRHYEFEAENNKQIGDWLIQEFESMGFRAKRQGQHGNIVASSLPDPRDARVLVGAHFDSVPNCPGADDNASAVAGMLGVAKSLSMYEKVPVTFVAFNREEDGLLGSRDFVENYLNDHAHRIEMVHILEMLGYCDTNPGSQTVPPGLPIKIRDTADFIGVISNKSSNAKVNKILKLAEKSVPDLPVTALKVFLGVEKFFPHLLRSDHSPFWESDIPALMWTDTSEFRNPHYHKASDTPDTLDYVFLKKVTCLLLAEVAERVGARF